MWGYLSVGRTIYPAVGHSPGIRHHCRGIIGGKHTSSLKRQCRRHCHCRHYGCRRCIKIDCAGTEDAPNQERSIGAGPIPTLQAHWGGQALFRGVGA